MPLPQLLRKSTALSDVLLFGSMLGLCIWGIPEPALGKTLQGQVQEIKHAPSEVRSEVGIVGLDLAIQPHRTFPIIKQVFPGTPAHGAGLFPGDEVMGVDDQSLWGLSVSEVDAAISNQPGTRVQFKIRRQGVSKTLELTVGSLSTMTPALQPVFSGLGSAWAGP